MVGKIGDITKEQITCIIPCYNEEENIKIIYNEICSVREADLQNYRVDILFVDDGSCDRTIEMIRSIADKDETVQYISFSRNFGKEAAIYAGLLNAKKSGYVAVMDADMQDPPSLLPEMVNVLESGDYDSVATRRESRTGEPKLRSACARMFYRLMNKVSDADIMDGARDFRLMKYSMVEAIISLSERNRFSKGIFGWVGFKTYWYSYQNVQRAAGKTKWNFWQLAKYALGGIINFSSMPLSLSAGLGLVCTGASFITVIVIIIRKLLGVDSAYGWASMMCLIAFIGGMQLLCMGIIGQYIAKTYQEVKGRPHYIATEVSNDEFIKIG